LHGGEQLGLARVASPESVVPAGEYSVLLQVVVEVAADDVLEELAADGGEGDGAVIFWLVSVAFLVD
jgi:hypothetical protein